MQPKVLYKFNVIPIKISKALFTDVEKTILKFVWNYKDPKATAKTILRKRNKPRSITVLFCFVLISSYTTKPCN